jgi:hypothetical protein
MSEGLGHLGNFFGCLSKRVCSRGFCYPALILSDTIGSAVACPIRIWLCLY